MPDSADCSTYYLYLCQRMLQDPDPALFASVNTAAQDDDEDAPPKFRSNPIFGAS